jgi:integrase
LNKYWDYDRSDYIREQLDTGHKIGRRYCYENRCFIDRYIKDFFHDRRLFEVTDVTVSDFLHSLKGKGLTAATVNCVRRSIVGPLKYAFKKHIIPADPSVAIEKFSGAVKERGILTPQEAEAVFNVEWSDRRAYIGNLIARNTGMRSAEILALRPADIGIDRIFVRHSYSVQDGLKGTKTDKPRIVPISLRTCRELREFMDDGSSPFLASPERFIFFSSIPEKPMEARILTDCLYEALAKIDPPILEKERRERNICFHSWRHYAAKYLADHADKDTAMLITGHTTESVFEHYADHQSAADAEDAFKKMKAALEGIDEPALEPLKMTGNAL